MAGDLRVAGIALRADGRRLTVTLDRPDRRNVQTPATWLALAELGRAVARCDLGVVVLRAEGPSFCAGMDRVMFTGAPEGEPGLGDLAALPAEELDARIADFQAGFTWWRDVDAVTVAAVGGHAVGAGFQLALSCDLRVLGEDAALAMRETTLGLVPDLTGTHPLVELVGYPRALELCASGRWVGAVEAASLGLAEAVVPRDELDAAVDDLAAAVLEAPAASLAATKRLLRGAAGRTPEQQRARERAEQGELLRALAGVPRPPG